MPLVAWSVLVYGAALIVALSGSAAERLAVGALALLAAALLSLAGRRVPATISALAAGAVLIASAVAVGETRCLAQRAAVREWQAELETVARAGDAAHVNVSGGICGA